MQILSKERVSVVMSSRILFKGPFIPSISINAAMTLAILFSIKTTVTPEWVCNPFSSNSTVFNENRITSITAALTLTLGVNGP